jgi:hypothetical protein
MENFQILRATHKFMALEVRGNLINIYSIINKHLFLDSSILLYMHKGVISYCLTCNYTYC